MSFWRDLGESISRPIRESFRQLRRDPLRTLASGVGPDKFIDPFNLSGRHGGGDSSYLPAGDGSLLDSDQAAYDEEVRRNLAAVQAMRGLNRTGGVRNGVMRNPFGMRMMDMRAVTPPKIQGQTRPMGSGGGGPSDIRQFQLL